MLKKVFGIVLVWILLCVGFQKLNKAFALTHASEDLGFANVAPIFESKCAACHVASGAASRMLHVIELKRFNLTDYLSGRTGGLPPIELKRLEHVVQKDSMPPRPYIAFHPQSKLTLSEQAALLKWVHAQQAESSNES